MQAVLRERAQQDASGEVALANERWSGALDLKGTLRALVINLRDEPVNGTFDRVLEVVPADDSARGVNGEIGDLMREGATASGW